MRELLQNAVDAITARRPLDPQAPALVRIHASPGRLRFDDTGIGLTTDDLHGLLATIGRSFKRDELESARKEFLGQFGIGLLACFVVAEEIERFVWDGHLEEHRFVTEKPIAAIQRCLSVQGTRVTRGGGLAPVTAEHCNLIVALLPVLRGLPTPSTPCRRPLLPLLAGVPEEGVEVVGHYDPWASGLAPRQGPTNLLVHFADRPWSEAARVLGEALAATRQRDAALVVVGVLASAGSHAPQQRA